MGGACWDPHLLTQLSQWVLQEPIPEEVLQLTPLLQDPLPGCGTRSPAEGPERAQGSLAGRDVRFSLPLQAKRKLDLEGPEFRTPKGKGRTLVQVPSPRSKWCWARLGGGTDPVSPLRAAAVSPLTTPRGT